MTKVKAEGGVGLRDFEAYNDAFLGKLSWRIQNKPNCLLSRVLMGKYCTDEPFLQIQTRASTSHGGRGILIGRDLIKQNMGWAVGNGESLVFGKIPGSALKCKRDLWGQQVKLQLP